MDIYIIAIIIILVLIGTCLLGYMAKEAFQDRVIHNEMEFEDFPAGFGSVTIFFISDIHRRKVSDKLLEQVKGKADLVIIGGDLAEKGVPLSSVKENIEKLKTVGPAYFVWGNNDYELNHRELDALLLESGVKILDNTAVSFEAENGDTMILMGVDDVGKGRDRLDLALQDAGPSGFKILACHNPSIIGKIEKKHGIRLVLSGHTHGGQIHILGYSPYEKGKVKIMDRATLLISNGYGTTALPLRLGARAETHLVRLGRKG
ncbi:metallophosphoesterase [Bacillus infantis]|uniref:metallophosphoesterase n=1 Tax=Bacillus infantis TaxID=324767 RepID=UPI003CE9ED9C